VKIKEAIPSLAELGGHQLYPADPSAGMLFYILTFRSEYDTACEDRRPSLLSILRSILLTYSTLTTSLLAPPPTPSSTAPPEWQQHVEWITILAQNIMAAANDLRPVQVCFKIYLCCCKTHNSRSQARGNLELMMKQQLELRREETKALHTCVRSQIQIGFD
jgi:mediator of RNA polymerase II transcription subunit 7